MSTSKIWVRVRFVKEVDIAIEADTYAGAVEKLNKLGSEVSDRVRWAAQNTPERIRWEYEQFKE